MNLIPQNRYISVLPIDEKEEKERIAIVLPSDYKKPENPHAMCRVLAVAADSKFWKKLSVNDTIVVEKRMLSKIEFNGKTSYLVLENYVYGSVKQWNWLKKL